MTRPPHRPSIWGVCGGSGSGKTTLARSLFDRLGDRAGFVAIDSYYKDLGYLTLEQRDQVNFDHPDSLDLDLFVEHLDQLRAGQTVEIPRYDFSVHSRSTGTDPLAPRDVVITEGILLLADPRIRARLDVAIFLDVDPDVRLERRVARDVAERGRTEAGVREVFSSVVQPMEQLFVLPMGQHADVIFEHPFDLGEATTRILTEFAPPG